MVLNKITQWYLRHEQATTTRDVDVHILSTQSAVPLDVFKEGIPSTPQGLYFSSSSYVPPTATNIQDGPVSEMADTQGSWYGNWTEGLDASISAPCIRRDSRGNRKIPTFSCEGTRAGTRSPRIFDNARRGAQHRRYTHCIDIYGIVFTTAWKFEHTGASQYATIQIVDIFDVRFIIAYPSSGKASTEGTSDSLLHGPAVMQWSSWRAFHYARFLRLLTIPFSGPHAFTRNAVTGETWAQASHLTVRAYTTDGFGRSAHIWVLPELADVATHDTVLNYARRPTFSRPYYAR